MPSRKNFKELEATFNIEPTAPIIKSEEVAVEVVPDPKVSRLDSDISYVFGVLNSTIEKSKEALDNALELAQETDQARAYEVVGQLVKQTVESAEKIIDIHMKLKDMEAEKSSSTSITQNNAIFVGRTEDALKLIRQAKLNDK